MATQVLYKMSLVLSICAFLLMFIAFASPFWYKSWTRVHSSFSNIGLWHICLSGYIMPGDPIMKSYVGCWWIHSTEFDQVKDHIMPPWFRGIQFLCVITLLCDLAAMILIILYLPKSLYEKLYKNRRARMFLIDSVLLLVSAFFVFLIALIFAQMVNDASWMPRPWMNYLSWSYGFCVLSGFLSAFAGMFLFIVFLIFKEKDRRGGEDGLDAPQTPQEKKPDEWLDNRDYQTRTSESYASRPESYSSRPSESYMPRGSERDEWEDTHAMRMKRKEAEAMGGSIGTTPTPSVGSTSKVNESFV